MWLPGLQRGSRGIQWQDTYALLQRVVHHESSIRLPRFPHACAHGRGTPRAIGAAMVGAAVVGGAPPVVQHPPYYAVG